MIEMINEQLSFYEKYDTFCYEHFKRVTEEREKIILERLKTLGIVFDIELEKQKRFKSFVTEKSNTEETIYFNDGSVKGLRVITFVTEYPEINNEGRTTSYTVKNSYY